MWCSALIESYDGPTEGAVRPHLLHRLTRLPIVGEENVVCNQWLLIERVPQTCRTEGVFALYKGFIPAYLRLGPWNIIVSTRSSSTHACACV